MVLSERHRAGVKPNINDLRDALHRFAALWAGEADVVDVRAVRIVDLHAGELLELLERADAFGVTVGAAPDWQRSAPVALARDRPVNVAAQPVAEAALLDVRWVPADRLVGGQHLIANLRGGDVPGRLGVIEQRRRAAPAVWIGVLVPLAPQQAASRLEVGDEVGVAVLDEAPLVWPDPLVVGTVEADRVDDFEPGLLA